LILGRAVGFLLPKFVKCLLEISRGDELKVEAKLNKIAKRTKETTAKTTRRFILEGFSGTKEFSIFKDT